MYDHEDGFEVSEYSVLAVKDLVWKRFKVHYSMWCELHGLYNCNVNV